LLAEPHKSIPHLLQPEFANLAPEILAVCIQAVTKIFGYWAAELALHWDDDDLPLLKELVELIVSRIKDFVTSQYIEVQERVR
jgi:AP-3 complex subunit delta